MLASYVARTIPVALDFDGCIALGEHVKIKYARLYHKIDISPRQCMKETYPLGSVMYKQLMDRVMEESTDEYTLDPHCKEVLEQLAHEGFTFSLVSSRYGKTLETCKAFIKKNKLPITQFYGTHDMPKNEICKRISARAMIDDTLQKLLDITENPMQLYFLRREWNTHEQLTKELNKRIYELSDWKGFAFKLREMKQMHEAICYYKGWINSDSHLSEIHHVVQKDLFFAKQCLSEYTRRD